jgi:hypothetical protein
LHNIKISIQDKKMTKKIKELFTESEFHSRKWNKYFFIYERLFKDYKDKDITFVEIGIQNGGSLEIWRKYFSTNSKIIGIDLNKDCKKFEKNGINVEIGNQSDPEFWKGFFLKYGKVDIILDDGGHTNLDQIITTVNTVKHIKDGGILVVEDTHTSYMKSWNSSSRMSFIEFSKKNIDDINSKHSDQMKKFKFTISNEVYSIEFYESIVAYRVDRSQTGINHLISNKGKDSHILDLTWEGNEIYFNKTKKLILKFKSIVSLRKFSIFLKNKINNKILKKFFE